MQHPLFWPFEIIYLKNISIWNFIFDLEVKILKFEVKFLNSKL